MESFSSRQEDDKETRDLKGLFDAFASICSLEEIASAYCSAKGNADAAADILVNLQNANNENYVPERETSIVENEKSSSILVMPQRSKKFTVSTGTVSNAMGRGYALSHGSRLKTSKIDEPLKPEVKQIYPLKASKLDLPANSKPPENKDVEDFLFSMLHDGFNLDTEKTQHVLRSCGYDVKKSMDGLLEMSSFNSAKSGEITPAENFTENGLEEHVCSENHVETGSQREVKDSCLGQQPSVHFSVLEALYRNTNIAREEPKRPRLDLGRNRKKLPREKFVPFTPSIDSDTNEKPTDIKALETRNDEDRYKIFREAAKSHWDMMKTYYEAAFDAFTAGDSDKANYLIEKGKHHNKLAREADEKSASEIIAACSMDKKDIFSLDLHIHRAKEAVKLLKQHLHSLAGIPSFSHLQITVNSDAEDVTKGRRKEAVLKFLEKRSIAWTADDGMPGIILIRLDLVDRQKLTSA